MKQLRNDKGVTQVILVFAMAALLAAAALVIDLGAAMTERVKYSNALDAAALAGAMELPGDPDNAIVIAAEYVVKNGYQITDAVVTIGDSDHSITVAGTIQHEFFLAPIIGFSQTDLSARAKAMVGSAGGIKKLRPFGVELQEFGYGQEVILKEGGGEGVAGNFGAVAFPNDVGTSDFVYNINNGYDDIVSIGDIISTEPGNMASAVTDIKNVIDDDPYATFDNYDPDSPRVWLIPIVDRMNVEGREDIVVVGFASFFIDAVGKNKGQVQVTGRFIEFTGNGTIDPTAPNYGVYAMKLIE